MKKTAIVLSILAVIFGVRLIVSAQEVRNTQNSVDFSSRSNLTVDPTTQALQLNIPLGSFAQRNGNLPVALNYSSKLWNISAPEPTRCTPMEFPPEYTYRSYATYGDGSKAGWTSQLKENRTSLSGYSLEYYDDRGQLSTTAITKTVARIRVTLPDGSRHELRKDDNIYPFNPNIGGKYYATDGSRLVYDKDTDILYLPDGSRFERNPTTGREVYRDRNGNEVVYENQGVTDTLGRAILSPLSMPLYVGQETGAAAADLTYGMPGLSGQAINYQMHWRKLSDAGLISEHETAQSLKYKGDWTGSYCGTWQTSTADALFHSIDEGFEHNQMGRGQNVFDPVVLHKIDLPNGQSYTFKYNVYGEISKIIYPTGAYERFAYGQVAGISGLFGADANGNSTIYGQANRGVTERWASPDGTAQSEVYYSYGASRSVVFPDGTSTQQYIFNSNPQELIAYGFDNPLYGKIYEERHYAANDFMMKRTLTQWTVDGSVVPGPFVSVAYKTRNPRVTREVSIVFEPNETQALASMTEIEYDSHSDPEYFAVLNPKRVKTYHYIVLNTTTAQTATVEQIAAYFTNSQLANISETDYLYDANYKARGILGLPVASRILNASGAIVAQSQVLYDEPDYPVLNSGIASQWVDPNTSYRGNVTTTRSWTDISANQFVETHGQYDNFGNLRRSWDAKGNLSQIEYSSSYNFAYPTKTISPVPGGNGSLTAFETITVYDYNTGLPTSSVDTNGLETRMEYVDPLLRPTKVSSYHNNQPVGAITETIYGAGTSEATRFVKVRSQIDETKWKEAYSWFDGLGRTYKSQSVDSSGDVFSETLFDNIGRPWKTSNPYRTGDAKIWTENFYDTAGRPYKVKTPDNAEVETFYSFATTGSQIGAVITVNDQAEKQRRSITNALGQLTRVDEPTDASGLGTTANPNQHTSYAYDTLNNLTTVTQGVQTRSFVYDSLSRLKQATNPESGAINYTYDANGNLVTKIDARSIVTTYAYDALNRLHTRSYTNEPTGSETPDVSYFYDNLTNAKGKLIKASSSVSTTEYTAFDILGRVSAHKQTTDGNDYTTGYAYNLSGAMIEETYPSTRKVKTVLDADGDLSIVQSTKNSASGYWNYANSFTYNPAGAVTSMQLGNGKWESTTFNSRLQLTQIALGTVQNGADKLNLVYGYGGAANNGNVLTQQITIPNVGVNNGFIATQTYTYDSLNRIKDATEYITGQTPPSWKQTFTYDRYGNRNFDEANTTTLPKECNGNTEVCAAIRPLVNPSVNTADNRLNGYTFDTGGNTAKDAENRKFTYDAENKQVKVETVDGSGSPTAVLGEYVYDGDGKRVKKTVPNGETVIFVYDAAGKLVAEYANQISQTPQVSYLTNDHLGSPRITTDANGQVISRRDFHPFGEEVSTAQRTQGSGYTPDNVRQKFTAYERDNESDLDYAINRYYNGSHGRFSSVDPYNIIFEMEKGRDEKEKQQIFVGYISQPQIWNKYIYSINNPLNLSDPDGRRPLTQQEKDHLQDFIKSGMDFANNEIADANERQAFINAVNVAANAIQSAILAVPNDAKEDPKNLRAVLYAMAQIGRPDNAALWSSGGKAGFNSTGLDVKLGVGNKCTLFVGIAYAKGANIGWRNGANPSGYQANISLRNNYYTPAANDLVNTGAINFVGTSNPQLGDIAAGRGTVNPGYIYNSYHTGHAGMYISGEVVISANPDHGVRVGRFSATASNSPNSGFKYLTYKP